jgi:hypothetical protein
MSQKTRGNVTIQWKLIATNNDSDSIRIGSGRSGKV